MTYQSLEMLVLRWAEQRQILGKASPATQMLKTVSEVGELCDAIIKGDEREQIDALGDVMVCLIILADMLDLDLTACLESAYDEIKGRVGTSLPNGTFVEATDGDCASPAVST